jgi:hypothetical protein
VVVFEQNLGEVKGEEIEAALSGAGDGEEIVKGADAE